MEISGKIIAVLPEQGGMSKTGNEWKKQEYVLETHEQYPKKVCFQIFGADRIAQAAIQMGEEVTVSFDIESREYNGRWYSNISAWKVVRSAVGAPGYPEPQPTFEGQATVPASTPPEYPPQSSSGTDDLPF
ncbi:MAG: DUF3127 domain-containing protein [Tannerellaceae bacterium]|jgi:hypothetical protein|nr:DUF3127 domain-containing protein [Tannerellaceae bacterium]